MKQNRTDKLIESIDRLTSAAKMEAKHELIAQLRQIAREVFPAKVAATIATSSLDETIETPTDMVKETSYYTEVMRLCEILTAQLNSHIRTFDIPSQKEAEATVIDTFEAGRRQWFPIYWPPITPGIEDSHEQHEARNT
jgi:hypothetical protein